VYTAVNNQTGELMAMKEIQLQPNDHRTTRRVAEELRIFEGIQHINLVRYYGVEIHRVSFHFLLQSFYRYLEIDM
jgi:serine/threonine protein kinase